MNDLLNFANMRISRLTASIEGSYGVLEYPVLVVATGGRSPWLAEVLLGRGFQPVRNPDTHDIVLKARLADGSVYCRASPAGHVSLLLNNMLAWSCHLDLEDPESVRWLTAARTREVTVISGHFDPAQKCSSGHEVDYKPVVTAKVATVAASMKEGDLRSAFPPAYSV